ncbi:MAG: ribokinase [Melioribacteraceae bacterium]|nr:ribokinase [Melioribacteraceae bacterium]
MKESILVVGSTNMDMVVRTDSFPRPGETLLGKKFQTFPGGKGANQAVGAAKLGAKTKFISKMGKDQFADELIENLKSCSVCVENILIDENDSTGIAIIMVNSEGENEIVVISGTNMKLTPEEIESKKELFTQSKVLLLQLEIPVETIVKAKELALQNGMTVILNPAPACKLEDSIFEGIDYLTPNETELEILSGKSVNSIDEVKLAAYSMLEKGIKNVIVTLGDKGSMLINKEKAQLFEPYKVNVIDTTAAGDAFNAGLAYSISKDIPIEDAIHFSNAVAASAVTKMGAQSSMPELSEVNSLL